MMTPSTRPAAGPLTAAMPKVKSVPSTRVRILGSYIVILGLALAMGLFLQRSLLLAQLNAEVNAQLAQEVEELRQLSEGRDPNTGQPFGNDVRAIFDTFLSRNIPIEGEALFTLVDGQPHASTVSPLQLLDDPRIVAEWAAVREPTQAELMSIAGDVRYLAVPIFTQDQTVGVFVVAIFLRERRADLDRIIEQSGIVYGSVFVVATALAWLTAGRILRPIRLLTEAARSITEEDWRQRIPVSGDEEIAELTRTFNDMLDRLESSFAIQRRFIDDAGHELRTPITIIRGHLELMGSDARDRDEVVWLVTDELDRMSRIVEDLLLLARAEQPDFLDLHPIDVGEFTVEIATKASALSDQRRWNVAGVANVVMIADRQRLTQAVMNLARNAVEHTPEGSSIEIESRTDERDVRISVRDDGEGIHPADHDLIFERFARGSAAPRRSDGAGLGLAIVRTIAEAHAGTVSVRSAPGTGSEFTLRLPLDGPGSG